MKRVKPSVSESPVSSKTILEQERRILLDLGNDLTRVRDKEDLIALFSKRLKGLFNITHAIVTLFDYKDETYGAFLYDIETSPIRSHPGYKRMFQTRFSLNEPFIKTALAAKGPISFLLEDVIDQPLSPCHLLLILTLKEALLPEVLPTYCSLPKQH